MKLKLPLILGTALLAMCGCHSHQPLKKDDLITIAGAGPGKSVIGTITEDPHDGTVTIRPQSEEEWYLEYTNAANALSDRTLDCMSEMISLRYSPVDSGPICKSACGRWRKMDATIDHSPVFDAEKYRLPVPSFCHFTAHKLHGPAKTTGANSPAITGDGNTVTYSNGEKK